MKRKWYGLLIFSLVISAVSCGNKPMPGELKFEGVVAPGAKLEKIAGGFTWAEGPAEDARGNIFFTDNRENLVYKLFPNGEVEVFIENSRGDNGLYIDINGILLSCASGSKELVSIDSNGNYTVLADSYDNKPLNAPNDLWVDPKGGIYFTDPYWGREQGRSRIYYLAPDLKKLILATDDVFKPNGVICTPDGRLLYVTDWVKKNTHVFTVNADGTLSDKKLFAPEGDDGMTMDTEGNVYLTGKAVTVYDPDGNKIDTIEVPEVPANLIFGGKDKQTLLITARTSIYSIRMSVKGL